MGYDQYIMVIQHSRNSRRDIFVIKQQNLYSIIVGNLCLVGGEEERRIRSIYNGDSRNSKKKCVCP